MRFEYHSGFQCWALRRYVDVQAALRDPQRFTISLTDGFDEIGHTRTLRLAMDAFLQTRFARWISALDEMPDPTPGPSELVSQWIEPWSHRAALHLVGLSVDRGDRLRNLARRVYAAAGSLEDASPELAALLPDTLGSLTVQAFVATSQTLAAFLANAVAALFEQSVVYPHTAKALEELLRFAGPSQAQFRYLSDATQNLAKGTRVALLLAEANRDPEQFEDPDRLDFERNGSRHLAFGLGAHACLGAVLIRAAAPVAFRHLTGIPGVSELESIEWPEGAPIIRSPLAIRIRELGAVNPRFPN